MSTYDLNAIFRPIDAWPGAETRDRQWSRFKASWPQTKKLLYHELEQLQAKNIVCQIAMREQDFRIDGSPRANAKASHPGVILSFDSKFGPLRYPCDTFTEWQDNVRAIALAMEKLRAVDRYGVTRRGEQYAGWKALPASTAELVMTVDRAARVVADLAYRTGEGPHPFGAAERILFNRNEYRDRYREAAKGSHPDTGGSSPEFQLLQEAKRVLDVHHNGTRKEA